MPRQVSAQVKKRQAELLFDDFIKIRRHKISTSREAGFEGDDVVSDTAKRLSGTFSRQVKSLQSRAPGPDVDMPNEVACAACPASSDFVSGDSDMPTENTESAAEAPSEECIHKVAEQLSQVADQLDAVYSEDKKDSKDTLLEKLREMRGNVPYDAFEKLLSEILPQDRDVSTLCVVMQLSFQVMLQLGSSFMSHFRQYVSEQFADVVAERIEEQLT